MQFGHLSAEVVTVHNEGLPTHLLSLACAHLYNLTVGREQMEQTDFHLYRHSKVRQLTVWLDFVVEVADVERGNYYFAATFLGGFSSLH